MTQHDFVKVRFFIENQNLVDPVVKAGYNQKDKSVDISLMFSDMKIFKKFQMESVIKMCFEHNFEV